MPTAITIRQVPGKPGQVWYPLDKIQVPHKEPGPNEVSHIHTVYLSLSYPFS